MIYRSILLLLSVFELVSSSMDQVQGTMQSTERLNPVDVQNDISLAFTDDPTLSSSSSSIPVTLLSENTDVIAQNVPDTTQAEQVSPSGADNKDLLILHLSDTHFDPTLKDTSKYGDDSSLKLIESALNYIKYNLAAPDFLLYTGDHAVHGLKSVNSSISTVASHVKMLNKYFGNIPRITTPLGNNDVCCPGYYLPLESNNKTYLYNMTSTVWNRRTSVRDYTIFDENCPIDKRQWRRPTEFINSQYELFRNVGYYTKCINCHICLVNLNTLIYSSSHKPDTSDVDDPFNQFAWFDDQLAFLHENKKNVYIIGHIPPTISSFDAMPLWKPKYIQRYLSIISKYTAQSFIKGQFYGHVHSMEFNLPITIENSTNCANDTNMSSISHIQTNQRRILRYKRILRRNKRRLTNESGNCKQNENKFKVDGYDINVPIFTSGSIAPVFGNNPTFCVWKVNSMTGEMKAFTLYGRNVMIKKGTNDNQIGWRQIYSSEGNQFKINDLSFNSLHKVYSNVITNDNVLKSYYNMAKGFTNKIFRAECDTALCKSRVKCFMIWHTSYESWEKCMMGYKISKNDIKTEMTEWNEKGLYDILWPPTR